MDSFFLSRSKFRPQLESSIAWNYIKVETKRIDLVLQLYITKTHPKFALSATRVKNMDCFCQQMMIPVKNKFKLVKNPKEKHK